jgi:hypothetical protein
MAETATPEPVVFLWPDGTEFSNDPIWLARKRLAEFQMANPTAPRVPLGPDDDTDFSEYDDMDGKALKAVANEKGVDISGLKKVGQVRAALIAFDEAQVAAKAAGDADNDDELDEESDDSDEESDDEAE